MTKSEWRFAIWAIGVVASIAFVFVFGTFLAQWRFEKVVKLGVPSETVLRAYGQPVIKLKAGETLEAWGRGQRVVTKETWVYAIFPTMSNRAVVSFDKNVVSKVEFQFN